MKKKTSLGCGVFTLDGIGMEGLSKTKSKKLQIGMPWASTESNINL